MTIVEDRRFEIMLKTFKRPPQSKGCCGRKKKEGIHGEKEESSESSDDDSDEEASVQKQPATCLRCMGPF